MSEVYTTCDRCGSEDYCIGCDECGDCDLTGRIARDRRWVILVSIISKLAVVVLVVWLIASVSFISGGLFVAELCERVGCTLEVTP